MMRDMFGFVRASGSIQRKRDGSGFFKDAPASQPYMMAIGRCECGKEECKKAKSLKECYECCRENEKQSSRSGFQNACGCGG